MSQISSLMERQLMTFSYVQNEPLMADTPALECRRKRHGEQFGTDVTFMSWPQKRPSITEQLRMNPSQCTMAFEALPHSQSHFSGAPNSLTIVESPSIRVRLWRPLAQPSLPPYSRSPF